MEKQVPLGPHGSARPNQQVGLVLCAICKDVLTTHHMAARTAPVSVVGTGSGAVGGWHCVDSAPCAAHQPLTS